MVAEYTSPPTPAARLSVASTPAEDQYNAYQRVVARNIQVPSDRLAEFCRRWHVRELALFGSVLRDDFRADSDIDILVRFAPDAHHSLLDLIEMEQDLTQIFGRKVDLVERAAVEASENYIRRAHILSTAEPVYVAR